MNKKTLVIIAFITGIILVGTVWYRYNGSTPEVVNTEDSSDVYLKDISSKVLIGSYIENKFADTAYANLVTREFSAGQSTWYAAWGGWQSENSFNFADFNAVVNRLRQNGKSTHMHMLVGPNFYMPEWLVNGTWTNDQLDALLKNMIYSIMDANDNKNKVDVWNVINELFDNDGNYVKDVIWYRLGWEADQSGLSGVDKINAQHPVFIRKAFQYARDKTNAKLEYRDHAIESNNPASGQDKKHKAVYQLLKHMLNSGIPVDAVGIQGHLDIGKVDGLTQNNDMKKTVEKFKALGLEVYITELDIGTAGQTWNDALAMQQKTDYYNYLRQAINGGASRIYVWGIADGSDSTWRTDEHPLPWDKNYKRKPAYDGIVQALKDTRMKPVSTPEPTSTPEPSPTQNQWNIMTWGSDTTEWIGRLHQVGLSGIRWSDSPPDAAVETGNAEARREQVPTYFISIDQVPPLTLTEYARQYSELSLTNPMLQAIGVDDLAFKVLYYWYDILNMTPSQAIPLLHEVINNTKSRNPNLKFAAVIYESELHNQEQWHLDDEHLPPDVRARIDYVQLPIIYRANGPGYANDVQTAKRLFPNAKIIAVSYPYDRIDYVPCREEDHVANWWVQNPQARCTPEQERNYYRTSLEIQARLLKQGIIDWIELFPGFMGNEEQIPWDYYNGPPWGMGCLRPRSECVTNTKIMNQIAFDVLNSELNR